MLYLGTNIKENRLRKGYTQEQLAYELGVSSQTVSRWETGTTYPYIVDGRSWQSRFCMVFHFVKR